LRPVVDYVDKLGCPTWRHLADSHLSPALLEDPEAPVPVRLFYDFADRVSRAEGIDHLGLRVAESISLESLGAFGDVLLRSRNVFRYLQTGCLLIPSVTTNARFWLEFEKGQVRFCHSEVDVDEPIEGFLLALGITIKTIRGIVGENWIPTCVSLPVAPLPRLGDISPSFTHARTDATRECASFTFPQSFLTEPMGPMAPEGSATGRLDFTTAHPVDFGESVRRLAEVLVHDGNANIPTAADASGMSVRTFQRRLAQCGLSFSKLALDARITLSERLLRERDRPITDVAFSLGYNDAANFSRAFRRANGLSPRAYRRVIDAAP